MNKADMRVEKDSMGDVSVPATKLWGAQTQRSFSRSSLDSVTLHPAFSTAENAFLLVMQFHSLPS
jgi:fumarate hydratase class II